MVNLKNRDKRLMTYSDIREKLVDGKKSHTNSAMKITAFGRFSVLETDKCDAIIVDSQIAKYLANRKWCDDEMGYPCINLDHKKVRMHDAVLALYESTKPDGYYVDHINQDKKDNRLTNLRYVTPAENSKNLPQRSNSKSGMVGVTITPDNTYRAYIRANNHQYNLGYYKTFDEAAAARKEAEDRLGFLGRPVTVKELVATGYLESQGIANHQFVQNIADDIRMTNGHRYVNKRHVCAEETNK